MNRGFRVGAHASKQQHQGIAKTLHSAIEKTTAPYIGILDSDDWLEPTCLEKCITPFLDGWEVGCVYTDYICESETQHTFHQNPDSTSPRHWQSLSERMIFPGNMPFHFRLWQRSAYDQTAGIDLSLQAAVDYDLMLKLSEVAHFTRIPEPLYHYRIHEQQISQRMKDVQIMSAKQASQNAIARRGLQDKLEAYLTWNVRAKG